MADKPFTVSVEDHELTEQDIRRLRKGIYRFHVNKFGMKPEEAMKKANSAIARLRKRLANWPK